MAVGDAYQGRINPVGGIRLAAVASNIRYADRLDLVLVEICEDASVSGVFTSNAFRAASVEVARRNLQNTASRYFMINTGNANAGTGEHGVDDAERCCQELAGLANVDSDEVLPFSTGVIGEPLPVEKICSALPALCNNLEEDSWMDAAIGILTTDTRPKISSRQLELDDQIVNITGIAKGSGMIKPDMATMLAFVFTDASIESSALQQLLNTAVGNSFNRITVDGDTSTNDCCMLVATGASGCRTDMLSEHGSETFTQAIDSVFRELATGLIRDAEGASKFVTVNVVDGASSEECLQVGYTIAESPLVKTALFASDPNWGRILAAVGRVGIKDLVISNVAIFLGEQLIAANGGVTPHYNEEQAQRVMQQDELLITIKLGRGNYSETVWTSDLSHEYIRINAEYRS